MQLLVIAWLALTAVVIVAAFVCAIGISQTSSAPTPSLAILKPETGALVEPGAVVEFVSPHGDLKHYVVVTPLQTPTRWIVDGPLHVVGGERAFGNARFGDASAGVGQRFSLQILCTTQTLPLGPQAELPAEGKLSPPVVVYRSQ